MILGISLLKVKLHHVFVLNLGEFSFIIICEETTTFYFFTLFVCQCVLTHLPPSFPFTFPKINSSTPAANIPEGPAARIFDIKYYTRDVVRNAPTNSPLGLSAAVATELGVPLPKPVDIGSPGMKNPDIVRYDPLGARSTMATNWTAVNTGLAAARPDHIPRFAAPTKNRVLKGWANTLATPGEC